MGVNEYAQGIIVGFEGALYDEESRSSAVVKHDSVFFVLGREKFESLASQDMEVSRRIFEVVTMQVMRGYDLFRQNLQLARGGGWHGTYYDRHTSNIAVAKLQMPAQLSSPTPVNRRTYQSTTSASDAGVRMGHATSLWQSDLQRGRRPKT